VAGDGLDLTKECFFIAPIGEVGSPERKRSDTILNYIITPAVAELGLVAVRGDAIGEPGQITLQVINHVLGAKAAVADLTGRNPNVYYELAIRQMVKLPLVLLAESGERLGFDIAQMRTIFVDHQDLGSADNCRLQIIEHLKRSFEGAVDSPISAAVDLRSLQAGNEVERNTAEIVNAVAQLSLRQGDLEASIGRLTRSTESATSTQDTVRASIVEIVRMLGDRDRTLWLANASWPTKVRAVVIDAQKRVARANQLLARYQSDAEAARAALEDETLSDEQRTRLLADADRAMAAATDAAGAAETASRIAMHQFDGLLSEVANADRQVREGIRHLLDDHEQEQGSETVK
jgi:hypothetical protein